MEHCRFQKSRVVKATSLTRRAASSASRKRRSRVPTTAGNFLAMTRMSCSRIQQQCRYDISFHFTRNSRSSGPAPDALKTSLCSGLTFVSGCSPAAPSSLPLSGIPGALPSVLPASSDSTTATVVAGMIFLRALLRFALGREPSAATPARSCGWPPCKQFQIASVAFQSPWPFGKAVYT